MRNLEKYQKCCIGLCQLFAIFCCPPCPSCILKKMAFHPPYPPSYILLRQGDGYIMKLKLITIKDGHAQYADDCPVVEAPGTRAFYLKKGMWGHIACYEILKYPLKSAPLIIYSSQNGEDMGLVHPKLLRMSEYLSCNVITYDYSGYGYSSGFPSEDNICRDIGLVFDYAVNSLSIPESHIFLFGMSMGSVPTIYLATQQRLAGIILLSAIHSALKVVFPQQSKPPKILCCFDKLRNIDRIRHVKCPVLFVHGKKDKLARFEAIKEVYDNCETAVEPMWNEDAGHEGCKRFPDFLERVRFFVTTRMERASIASQGTELDSPAVLRSPTVSGPPAISPAAQ